MHFFHLHIHIYICIYIYIHTYDITLHCITLRYNTIQWQYIYSTFTLQYITLHTVTLHTYMPAKVHQIARTEVMVRNFQGQKSGLSFIKVELSYTYFIHIQFTFTFLVRPARSPLGGHHENTKLIWKHNFAWKWLRIQFSIYWECHNPNWQTHN